MGQHNVSNVTYRTHVALRYGCSIWHIFYVVCMYDSICECVGHVHCVGIFCLCRFINCTIPARIIAILINWY